MGIPVCIQVLSSRNSAALGILYTSLQAHVQGEIPRSIDVGVDLLGRTVACANFSKEKFLCKAVYTLFAVNEVSQLYTFLATLEFV